MCLKYVVSNVIVHVYTNNNNNNNNTNNNHLCQSNAYYERSGVEFDSNNNVMVNMIVLMYFVHCISCVLVVLNGNHDWNEIVTRNGELFHVSKI
ncbi:Protein of unknown function [Gryllus bimaculatus]|nr:Protein of unknown function [Gryllus bimaculatus]